MSAPEVATKTCGECGEVKPLSGFYRNYTRAGGRQWRCKDCSRKYQRRRQEQRKEEMGEEAWYALQREILRKHRAKLKEETGTMQAPYQRAYRAAMGRLREAYPKAFEQLLNEERYKLGLDPKGEE